MPDDARVLIVEHDPELRSLYVDHLAERYEVTAAATGEEALDLLEDVDVVLLDRRLPGQRAPTSSSGSGTDLSAVPSRS